MIVSKDGDVAGSIDRAALEELQKSEPEPEVETDDREDGVHSVGGGWHEVVVDGEVVDKVRGSEAAEEAYETYREVSDGDD